MKDAETPGAPVDTTDVEKKVALVQELLTLEFDQAPEAQTHATLVLDMLTQKAAITGPVSTMQAELVSLLRSGLSELYLQLDHEDLQFILMTRRDPRYQKAVAQWKHMQDRGVEAFKVTAMDVLMSWFQRGWLRPK